MAAKKNLDNQREEMADDILSEHKLAEENLGAYELDDGSDVLDDEDDDLNLSFVLEDEDDEEEDQSDDMQEEEESEDEPDSEEDDQPEVPAKKKPPNKTSKEEKAIVALKREQKRLLEENRKMQAALKTKQDTSKLETLEQRYVSEGHDEATAKYMATQDLKAEQLQNSLSLLEFKDANEDVLRMYPGAGKNISQIRAMVETAGITVEQACRGLFGNPDRPEYEERARNRVAADDDGVDNSISRSSRSSKAPTQTRLTAEERRHKRYIENRLLDGEKLSDKDFLRIYSKKG